jgi:hypothetical protein
MMSEFRDRSQIETDRAENLQIARYRFGTRRDQTTERIIERALDDLESRIVEDWNG